CRCEACARRGAGSKEERPQSRRWPATPLSTRIHRDSSASPRRRDRRHYLDALLLEWLATLAEQARRSREEVWKEAKRAGVTDAALGLLHVGLRRSHRGAAHS